MVRRTRLGACIALPRAWPTRVKAAVLNAVALAHMTLTHVRCWSETSPLRHVRDAAAIASLGCQLAQTQEECPILRARVASIPPRERPHYPPPERLAILALRAGTGWTLAETARRFVVTTVTIASWMGRLEEQGERALVGPRVPVNRFPDFVRAIVAALRVTAPMLGKVRIAQILARAGLVLAASTVGRMRKKTAPPTGTGRKEEEKTAVRGAPGRRVVTARHPHHVWHVDLTLLPTSAGFWVPWWPLSLLQRWPFCFWLGVVLDHFSRSIVGWRLFLKQPTGLEVVGLLERAKTRAGIAPKHIVSDQGVQFGQAYRAWCKRRGVRPRFGASGRAAASP
jgi:transposase-like protein